MNKLGFKNIEKNDILSFLVFFMLISLRYPTKLFVKGKNMYIFAIAANFSIFQEILCCMNKLGFENTEKKDIFSFFGFIYTLIFKISQKYFC